MLRGLLFLLVLCSCTFAHKLNIFTQVEQNSITLQSYFASGQGCQSCSIEVNDSDNKVVLAMQTNDEGKANFALNNGHYTVSVEAIGGHKSVEKLFINGAINSQDSESKNSFQKSSSVLQTIFALLGVVAIIVYLKRIKQ